MLISAGFGAGFALCVAVIVGSFYWYSSRPKPWNKNALKATFATMEFDTRPQEASYKVDFLYNLENTTERNYDFNSSNFTLLAVLADGNALSKDLGHYQAEDPRLDGPPFIPAHGKARIHVVVAYEYPSDWTPKEKNDAEKVIKSLNHRLRELTGFVAYDQIRHYEIDMPEGWRNWDDVKKKDTAVQTESLLTPCPKSDPLGLSTSEACAPLPPKDCQAPCPPCPANDPVGLHTPQRCTPLPARQRGKQ